MLMHAWCAVGACGVDACPCACDVDACLACLRVFDKTQDARCSYLPRNMPQRNPMASFVRPVFRFNDACYCLATIHQDRIRKA